MAISLKELSRKGEKFAKGHRACMGCVGAVVMRQVMLAAEGNVVVSFATGCIEVATTIYPYTAWECSYIHNAFENSAATLSGVETAYRALKKRGRLNEDFKFIAFGGDGGTYDIGIQALSGAMERGHNLLYICYNNEAYMNTGIQRSGATPLGAATNTAPAGSVIPGKVQAQKDLTAIIAAHNVPYIAQASPHNWKDLITKVQKALDVAGPAFINVLSPCFRGWRFPAEQSIEIARLATETRFWPLYEVVDGKYSINYTPKEKLPVTDYIFKQGRFSHLKQKKNGEIVQNIQKNVDTSWERLLMLAERG